MVFTSIPREDLDFLNKVPSCTQNPHPVVYVAGVLNSINFFLTMQA